MKIVTLPSGSGTTARPAGPASRASVHDLPAGEPRVISRARGIEWSIVNGQPVLERGAVVERPAGARPGHVVRSFDA